MTNMGPVVNFNYKIGKYFSEPKKIEKELDNLSKTLTEREKVVLTFHFADKLGLEMEFDRVDGGSELYHYHEHDID